MTTVRPIMDADLVRKAGRYFVVGGVSALADWAFFALFLYAADVHYLAAGLLSFVFATALNYALSVRYVFDAGRRSRRAQIALTYAVSVVGVLINLAVLGGLVEYLALHPMVSKLGGTASAFGWNFCARYFWIFER